jgi:hypothetical protein
MGNDVLLRSTVVQDILTEKLFEWGYSNSMIIKL